MVLHAERYLCLAVNSLAGRLNSASVYAELLQYFCYSRS